MERERHRLVGVTTAIQRLDRSARSSSLKWSTSLSAYAESEERTNERTNERKRRRENKKERTNERTNETKRRNESSVREREGSNVRERKREAERQSERERERERETDRQADRERGSQTDEMESPSARHRQPTTTRVRSFFVALAWRHSAVHMPRSKQDGRLSCRKEGSRGTGDTEADGERGTNSGCWRPPGSNSH